MNPARFLLPLAILSLSVGIPRPLGAAELRPKLQIINGSSQPIDIFWLKSDTERVPNGSVAPGKDTFITTTLGHRFVVVSREDKATATVTSEVPVQGFRFDLPGKNGVPAFYTQSVSAHVFPIVASAKVNPSGLKEAAFLVEMMLARRPDVRAAWAAARRITHQGFDRGKGGTEKTPPNDIRWTTYCVMQAIMDRVYTATKVARFAASKLPPSAKVYDTLAKYQSLVPRNNQAFRDFANGWWGKPPLTTGHQIEHEHAQQWQSDNEQTAAQIKQTVQRILDQYFPGGKPREQ